MPADTTKFQCTGNCMNCIPAQRTYCASQHSYSNMRVLDNMMNIVMNMQNDVKTLALKIEAMQNNEAMVFAPESEEKSENQTILNDTTQSGDGAESRSPETI